MYTTADEDRSDLFLAGGVYVFGPLVIDLLFDVVPTGALAAIYGPLRAIIIILTTIAVPLWLIRYRKQRLSEFGFDGSSSAFGSGFLAALPLGAIYLLIGVLGGGGLFDRTPVVAFVTTAPVDLALHLLSVVCTALLAIYCTVKARTSFRSDPQYLRPTALELGRYLAIAGAAATALLVLTTFVQEGGSVSLLVEFILAPVGVVAVLWVVLRGVHGSQLTSRPVLLTPMFIMAAGSLVVFGGAFNFVFGIWRGAMLAGIGMAVGLLLEHRRSAMAPLGLALGLGLLTMLVL